MHVEDVAEAAVGAGEECKNTVVDCVGPEVYTYEQLVRLVANQVGVKAKIVHVPPSVALVAAQFAGYLVRDVVLTRDEIDGLMAGLLVSENTPTGHILLSHWLNDHSALLGTKYASELRRHYR